MRFPLIIDGALRETLESLLFAEKRVNNHPEKFAELTQFEEELWKISGWIPLADGKFVFLTSHNISNTFRPRCLH